MYIGFQVKDLRSCRDYFAQSCFESLLDPKPLMAHLSDCLSLLLRQEKRKKLGSGFGVANQKKEQ